MSLIFKTAWFWLSLVFLGLIAVILVWATGDFSRDTVGAVGLVAGLGVIFFVIAAFLSFLLAVASAIEMSSEIDLERSVYRRWKVPLSNSLRMFVALTVFLNQSTILDIFPYLRYSLFPGLSIKVALILFVPIAIWVRKYVANQDPATLLHSKNKPTELEIQREKTLKRVSNIIRTLFFVLLVISVYLLAYPKNFRRIHDFIGELTSSSTADVPVRRVRNQPRPSQIDRSNSSAPRKVIVRRCGVVGTGAVSLARCVFESDPHDQVQSRPCLRKNNNWNCNMNFDLKENTYITIVDGHPR